MIYAATAKEIEQRRKAFLRKWRLKCRAVADSLEEAGEQLFTFTRLPASRWKSARTTNAIERLHEEVSIPRQSRGHYGVSRSKRLFGDADAAPASGPPEGGGHRQMFSCSAAHPPFPAA